MEKKIELWQPIVKSNRDGNIVFEAVLSDNSVDRDDEIVGKEALIKVKDCNTMIVGLMDHENKIMNQVCEWINKRIEDRNGHTAFIAEPKFFMSNPNAKILKGMLDEGANMGISIGAIVKDSEMRKYGDDEKRVFTDIEVVEASFVAVPANAHARITAVAKMFKTEEKKLTEKTYSEKEFEAEVSKVKELQKELDKAKEDIDAFKGLKKDLAKVTESSTELEKELSKKSEEIKELEADVEKYKNAPVLKAQHTQEPTTEEDKALEKKQEDEKKLKAGMIPVRRY